MVVKMEAIQDLYLKYDEIQTMTFRMLSESWTEEFEIKKVQYDFGAEERVRWFMEKYPTLDQQVEDYHIASFLHMTPVSLSRIRRKIREESTDKRNRFSNDRHLGYDGGKERGRRS